MSDLAEGRFTAIKDMKSMRCRQELSESCRASHADMVTRISIVRSHRGSERDYLVFGSQAIREALGLVRLARR